MPKIKNELALGVLCQGFKRYSDNAGWTGETRDRAALTFFAGAALALAVADHARHNDVTKFAVGPLKDEGYIAILKLLGRKTT